MSTVQTPCNALLLECCSTNAAHNLQPLAVCRICQDVSARVPGYVRRGGRNIDLVYNFPRLHMGNAELLLLLVVGPCGDVAAVEGEVDALDELLGEVEGAHTQPLLGVPQRDERVASTRSHVVSTRRHGDGVARGCVGAECERVVEGRVVDELDAAIAASHEEMVAGPVEDALVGLGRLAVLLLDAHGCAVDCAQQIVLPWSA
jgi:hypothetical protein